MVRGAREGRNRNRSARVRRKLSSADPLEALREARAVRDVELRRAAHLLHLGVVERADHPRRRTDDQGPFGEFLALGDDGAGADDAVAADPGAVHHDGAHADECALLDGAAVQDDVVADRTVPADVKWKTEIRVAGRAVLPVGAPAHLAPTILAGA